MIIEDKQDRYQKATQHTVRAANIHIEQWKSYSEFLGIQNFIKKPQNSDILFLADWKHFCGKRNCSVRAFLHSCLERCRQFSCWSKTQVVVSAITLFYLELCRQSDLLREVVCSMVGVLVLVQFCSGIVTSRFCFRLHILLLILFSFRSIMVPCDGVLLGGTLHLFQFK